VLSPSLTLLSLTHSLTHTHTHTHTHKAVHNDPKNWKEPRRYKPERFDEPYDPYAFLPFINGPRNCLGQHLTISLPVLLSTHMPVFVYYLRVMLYSCLGQHLALLEARIVMSLLLMRFTFVPRDEHIGDVHATLVPTCPAHGMHFFIE
jgi:cytochrome P450